MPRCTSSSSDLYWRRVPTYLSTAKALESIFICHSAHPVEARERPRLASSKHREHVIFIRYARRHHRQPQSRSVPRRRHNSWRAGCAHARGPKEAPRPTSPCVAALITDTRRARSRGGSLCRRSAPPTTPLPGSSQLHGARSRDESQRGPRERVNFTSGASDVDCDAIDPLRSARGPGHAALRHGLAECFRIRQGGAGSARSARRRVHGSPDRRRV